MSNNVFVAVIDSDEKGKPELADGFGTDSTKSGTKLAPSIAALGEKC
jgi:hypothetical protein